MIDVTARFTSAVQAYVQSSEPNKQKTGKGVKVHRASKSLAPVKSMTATAYYVSHSGKNASSCNYKILCKVPLSWAFKLRHVLIPAIGGLNGARRTRDRATALLLLLAVPASLAEIITVSGGSYPEEVSWALSCSNSASVSGGNPQGSCFNVNTLLIHLC